MLTVFKRLLKKKGKSKIRDSSICMEDPLELLLKLSGENPDFPEVSESSVLQRVKGILSSLDLNNDGNISW